MRMREKQLDEYKEYDGYDGHALFCLSPILRSNRHSVGGPQGGELTNGELIEEQTPGSCSSGRRRSSKSHVSPGSSAGMGGRDGGGGVRSWRFHDDT